jgi:hypothetical protein
MTNKNNDNKISNDQINSDPMESLLRWALSPEREKGGSADRAAEGIKKAVTRAQQLAGSGIDKERRVFLQTAPWATAAGVIGLVSGAIPSVGYARTATAERKKRSELEQTIAEAAKLGLFDPVVLDGRFFFTISSENEITVSGHAATDIVSAVEVKIGTLKPRIIKPETSDSRANLWKVFGTFQVPLTGETLDVTVRAIPVKTDMGPYNSWFTNYGKKESQLLANPLGLSFASKKPLAVALRDGHTLEDIEYVTCTSARDGWLVAVVENIATAEFFCCTTQQVKQNGILTARMDLSPVAGKARLHLGFLPDTGQVPMFELHQAFRSKPGDGIEWFRELPVEIRTSSPELRAARVVFSQGGLITIHAPAGKSLTQVEKEFETEQGLPSSFLIQTIELPYRPISKHTLRSLSGMNSLQGFLAAGSGLSNDDVTRLAKENPRLLWIRLNDCFIDDIGIKAIAELKDVESLEIADTLVSDASIEAILSMRHLKHLNVRHTKISANGIRTLQERLPTGSTLVSD